MIIVVLLFFQSLCLYLQNIVLTVHEKWLNPKHARILIDKEQRRLQLFAQKPKHPVPGCRFCSNSPLGYCRHHNPNQPTLRHLKNRLLVKGGSASSVAIGGDSTVGLKGGAGGSGESSVLSTSSSSALSTCETLASYFDRKDPDKICTCISCSRGAANRNASTSHYRRNRTSWGTRNGTVIWGERIVNNDKNNNNQSHNGRSSEDNCLELVLNKRRRRRYEKFGGFH